MSQFKPGDQVELKSGSKTMTVEKVADDGQCLCVWMVNGEGHKEWFLPVVLQRYYPTRLEC